MNLNQSLPYLINCIYLSTEGEGIYIGSPQIFIRFQGCLIGCVNCDSKETWSFTSVEPRSFASVLQEVQSLNQQNTIPVKRISITGGDPLHPRHEGPVLELAKALKDQGYFINIEASGTRIVENIFRIVDFISFDFKTPSTQVKVPLKNLLKLITNYEGKFQIKAVISSEEDFDETWHAYQQVKEHVGNDSALMNFNWCLTPAFTPGEDFSPERFTMILRKNEAVGGPFRVIGQQHKWVYGPNVRQV